DLDLDLLVLLKIQAVPDLLQLRKMLVIAAHEHRKILPGVFGVPGVEIRGFHCETPAFGVTPEPEVDLCLERLERAGNLGLLLASLDGLLEALVAEKDNEDHFEELAALGAMDRRLEHLLSPGHRMRGLKSNPAPKFRSSRAMKSSGVTRLLILFHFPHFRAATCQTFAVRNGAKPRLQLVGSIDVRRPGLGLVVDMPAQLPFAPLADVPDADVAHPAHHKLRQMPAGCRRAGDVPIGLLHDLE